MRIAGVILPNKRIVVSLTYIKGIGNTTANKICKDLSLDINKYINDVTDAEAAAISDYISKNLVVEGDLVRKTQLSIKSIISLNGFKAKKHTAKHRK